MFKSLEISNWRQFQHVELQFHEKLTILTGANGSGKTTILNILSKHYGWEAHFVSTPKREKGGAIKFEPSVFDELGSALEAQESSRHLLEIGGITYPDLSEAKLLVPATVSNQYDVQIKPLNQFPGLHIPSHRRVPGYQGVSALPTRPISKQQAFQSYNSEVIAEYSGSHGNRASNYLIKETLLSLAVFGYGNEIVSPNHEAMETFERFQEILKSVLPPKLGFQKLAIYMPEVILKTRSGDFSLDAVSGGIASIIGMAWLLFMYSPSSSSFVASIDEPENHLHPELQMTLLPNFIRAFPNVQFIVATHNPFIISSEPNSNVYVLDYNKRHRVESTRLDLVDKAGTANDVLRDVLGLPFTMPIWAETALERIVRKYQQQELTEEILDQMRAELTDLGLGKLFSNAIVDVVEGTN